MLTVECVPFFLCKTTVRNSKPEGGKLGVVGRDFVVDDCVGFPLGLDRLF